MKNLYETLQAQPGFTALRGASAGEIAQAAKALNVTFAEDYRQMAAAYGVVSYEGHELTGVCPLPRVNVVEVTKAQRAKTPGIPAKWYVLEQTDSAVYWQNANGGVFEVVDGVQNGEICQSIRAFVNPCGD